MEKNIVWKGIFYNSLENCIVSFTDEGLRAKSVIIGYTDESPFYIEYEVKTNHLFETQSATANYRYKSTERIIQLTRQNSNEWTINGNLDESLSECKDIDISLTPFSNTLPIKRLSFDKMAEYQIKVIYIDILRGNIKPVYQKYSKLSNNLYRFENVPNDFEAEIEFDELGLVTYYPKLFDRKIINENNYR
ncbi:MAG TPA: putative glycolipid-binding domain-containing protein [Bacteroidales bacterium]